MSTPLLSIFLTGYAVLVFILLFFTSVTYITLIRIGAPHKLPENDLPEYRILSIMGIARAWSGARSIAGYGAIILFMYAALILPSFVMVLIIAIEASQNQKREKDKISNWTKACTYLLTLGAVRPA